jgi:hypothetical protein
VKRYDLVVNYRCGQSIEEMEPSDVGDWVRWEDVEAALGNIEQTALQHELYGPVTALLDISRQARAALAADQSATEEPK